MNRRLEDRHTLDQLFDQMKQFRIEIAGEAGFPNFVEYAFRDRERFDYGIDDSIRFQKAVERVVVPLSRQIQEKHRAALRRDVLRPWDLSVDPLGRPPLQPFQDVEQLAAGTESIFREVDPDLGSSVRFSPVETVARPCQPEGKGSRRLPDDSRGCSPAFHLHERGRPRFGRADLAPRGRARLSYARLPG